MKLSTTLKQKYGANSLKNIGPAKLTIIQKFFHEMTMNEIDLILCKPYYMYVFFFYWTKSLDVTILKFLFSQYTKAKINTIVRQLDDGEVDIMNLDLLSMIQVFRNTVQQKCALPNIFLQDLFQPENIFKRRYTPFNFDIFSTSFYYLMNCQYTTTAGFPLRINDTSKTTFSFPFDIHLSEWIRPIILIDVQNVMRGPSETGDFQLNGQVYKGSFKDRKRSILENRSYILRKLFEKHNDSNTMVLFMTQSDTKQNPNQTCLKITNLKNTSTQSLLQGNGNNRVALFIEVPCTKFVYNTNDAIVHDYTLRDTHTGRIYRDSIYRYWYDNYNRLYVFNENEGRYKLMHNNSHIPSSIIKPINRHAGKNLYSGNQNQHNKFLDKVGTNSNCSIGLKNELDDFMVGLILFLNQEVAKNCFRFITEHIPIVFTRDNYSWMRSTLKNSCTFEFNFIGYLESTTSLGSTRINRKNLLFWNENVNPSFSKTEVDVLCKKLIQNLCSA